MHPAPRPCKLPCQSALPFLLLHRRFFRHTDTLLGSWKVPPPGTKECKESRRVALPSGVNLGRVHGVPEGVGPDGRPAAFKHPERIFLALVRDTRNTEEPKGTIERVARVAYVRPGQKPPPASAADYWFDQVRPGPA